jgi:dipeptidyl aminopeptidase/acylaminoacyl peptidase
MRATTAVVLLLLGSPAYADRLVDAHQVARGDYLAPRFAPDGRALLITGPQLRGLYLVSIAGGSVSALTDDLEAGVHARWADAKTIAYRSPRDGSRRDLSVDRSRRVRAIGAPAAVAFAKDDRMYAIDRTGRLAQVGSGDRFFGAVVAPDGDKVVFQGLVTGLYLYVRSTGVLTFIGTGTAPAWSPDSRRIAFELTEDDGHDVVASDLYMYELAGDRVSPLTSTDRVIERRPSFSPGGDRIAFDDNEGGVFVGRLEVR